MSKDILITPNSIARGSYTIDAKENNLFLKIMYAIQRDHREYLLVKRKDEELTIEEQSCWDKLSSIETLETTIYFDDLKEIYKHKEDLLVKGIKNNLETLRKCEISIDTILRDGTRASLHAGLIDHYYFIEDTKDIRVVVPARIYKFLFDLGLGHSQNALQILYNLKSQYSQRLYLILRSWSGTKKKIEFTVTELRTMLKLGSKYSTYKLFKANVLKRAIDEINRTGVMNVSIDSEVKNGRNIISIIFLVKDNEPRSYSQLFEEKDESVLWLDYIKVENQSLLDRLILKYSDIDLNSVINRGILHKAYNKTLNRDNRFNMIEDKKGKSNYALFNHIVSGEFLTHQLDIENQFNESILLDLNSNT